MTLGFFLNSANGNGIWILEVGFGKKLGREMGLVPPPPSGPSKHIELTEESGETGIFQKIKQKSKPRDSRTDSKVIVLFIWMVEIFHRCLLETTFDENSKIHVSYSSWWDRSNSQTGMKCLHGTNHPLGSILHVSIIHQLGMLQRHFLTVHAQNTYLRPVSFELQSCLHGSPVWF